MPGPEIFSPLAIRVLCGSLFLLRKIADGAAPVHAARDAELPALDAFDDSRRLAALRARDFLPRLDSARPIPCFCFCYCHFVLAPFEFRPLRLSGIAHTTHETRAGSRQLEFVGFFEAKHGLDSR